MLSAAVALYFFANLQRVAIPGSIFNELQSDLNVGAKYITALSSMFMYIYAAGQLCAGLLADRYGGERVIACGALLFCLGSILFPFSESLPMLYFCRFLVGMGASAIYLSLVKILAQRFPKKFPVLLGFFLLWGYAGGVVATAPLVAMVQYLSWRTVMLIFGAATVVAYIFFAISKKMVRLPRVADTRFSPKVFIDLLKRKHNRNMIAYSCCSFGAYYCIHTVIGKKFLEDFCQMPATAAAGYIAGVGIIASVSGFIMALVSQRCGNRRKIFLVISGSLAVFSYGFILLALCLDWKTHFVGVLLFVVAWFANQGTLTVPIMKDTNVPEAMGAIVSLCNGLVYMVVALLGNAVGILLDLFEPVRKGTALIYTNNSYIAVFTLFLLMGCGTLYNALKLRDTRGKNVASTTP